VATLCNLGKEPEVWKGEESIASSFVCFQKITRARAWPERGHSDTEHSIP
jgi:hypothetical protein